MFVSMKAPLFLFISLGAPQTKMSALMTELHGQSQTKYWTHNAWLWFHEGMMTYQMPVSAVNYTSGAPKALGGKTAWNG